MLVEVSGTQKTGGRVVQQAAQDRQRGQVQVVHFIKQHQVIGRGQRAAFLQRQGVGAVALGVIAHIAAGIQAQALVGAEDARQRVVQQVLFAERGQIATGILHALQQQGLLGRAVEGPEGLHVHFRRHADALVGLALQLGFQLQQCLLGLLAQLHRVGHKAHAGIALAQGAGAPALQRGDLQLAGHLVHQRAQAVLEGLDPGPGVGQHQDAGIRLGAQGLHRTAGEGGGFAGAGQCGYDGRGCLAVDDGLLLRGEHQGLAMVGREGIGALHGLQHT